MAGVRSTKRLLLAALLALVCAWGAAHADDGAYRFSGAERVVAFGDVHGAYAELVELLTGLGLVDEDLHWTGGETHLVSVGDLLHRGDRGRDVLDLLMRLETEAAAAGGRVHVVLGNHEVMTLTGDWRYVSEGDRARFGGSESRRDAFARDGEYGAWLLSKPVMVVIDGTAFLHGGVSRRVVGMSLEAINSAARRDIARVVDGRERLVAERRLAPDADFDALRRAGDAGIAEALRGLPFDPDGPLWYRGSSLCHPYAETETVDAVLAGIGAERVVVGHTVTTDRRIASRLQGRVYRIDVGMNRAVYGGGPAALVIDGDRVRAWHLDGGYDGVAEEPNRVWARPYGMSDAEIEAFLRTATITRDEEIPIGITRPRRVTLEQDGRTMRAAFKSVDTDPRLPQRRWQRSFDFADRYVYEVAAYKLDRLLGLEMLPVAVLREIDGREGALVYWLENTINETDRQAQGLDLAAYCDPREQFALMNVFHALVHNVDPNTGNILYDRDSWKLWVIDHSRAFGTQRGVPAMVRGSYQRVSPQLSEALSRVTRENLTELEPYLHRRQIQALVDRAKGLRR